LERALGVPDRDRVRIVLVRPLRHERQPLAGIERRIGQRVRAVGDARRGNHADARILPAHGLAGRRVAEPVAALAALEPESQALAHPEILPSARTAATLAW
jgi:hypothetical protein